MKILVTLIFVILYSNMFSQISENSINEYVGILKTNEGDVISYKLNFDVNNSGEITGESVTDIYGLDRTVSKIIGTYDFKSEQISFKEISNLNSKSITNDSLFCFIQIEKLKLKSIKGLTLIQGDFVGEFNDGDECVNGKIYLSSSDILDGLKDKGINVDSLKNLETIDKDKILQNIKSEKILKSNDSIQLIWPSKRVLLEVWDSYSEDGDKITIIYNGLKIADFFEIKNEKQFFELDLINGKNIIKFIAMDEGDEAMNTVNINLIDNNGEITSLVSSLKKRQLVYVELIKK